LFSYGEGIIDFNAEIPDDFAKSDGMVSNDGDVQQMEDWPAAEIPRKDREQQRELSPIWCARNRPPYRSDSAKYSPAGARHARRKKAMRSRPMACCAASPILGAGSSSRTRNTPPRLYVSSDRHLADLLGQFVKISPQGPWKNHQVREHIGK
jgi:hypothetical protein